MAHVAWSECRTQTVTVEGKRFEDAQSDTGDKDTCVSNRMLGPTEKALESLYGGRQLHADEQNPVSKRTSCISSPWWRENVASVASQTEESLTLWAGRDHEHGSGSQKRKDNDSRLGLEQNG